MSDFIKIGGKLALICAVAAITLALVNAVTEPKIEELRRVRQAEILGPVVPDNAYLGDREEVEHSNVVGFFHVYDNEDNSLLGYICELKGRGYAGNLNVLAFYDKTGVILFSVMMDNEETPGIGKIFENADKLEFLVGTGGDIKIPTRKGDLRGAAADIVSGATVTYEGIAGALKAGSEFVVSLEG